MSDEEDTPPAGALNPAVVEHLLKEESSPMTDVEKDVFDQVFAGLSHAEKEFVGKDSLDTVMIIRGFQRDNPRVEKTLAAFKRIAAWRRSVNYGHFLDEKFPNHALFHTCWQNRVYGEDKMGHLITAFKYGDIDTDKLAKLDIADLERLQGQRMLALHLHKKELSKAKGHQRYKNIVIIDGAGISLSHLRGAKKECIKHLMDVGSHFFPESTWKIYIVNAPTLFRAVWAVVKPWLHPDTAAKVSLTGNNTKSTAAMQQDGIPLSSIPDWMGGQNRGADVQDIVAAYIDKKTPPW